MVQRIVKAVNGYAQTITLIFAIVASIGASGGWLYQVKANEKQIEIMRTEYVRKDVITAELRSINDKIEMCHESSIDLKSELKEIKKLILRKQR